MTITDDNTGWITHAWIEIKSNSIYGFINEFKCKGSNLALEEESLFISRKNFKYRGNETDKLYYYNRNASPIEFSSVWKDWDDAKIKAKARIDDIKKKYNIQN